MGRQHHKFQSPPPADPISAARDSSLAFRLNIGFFLRQLGVFLVMDLLLLLMITLGMVLYAENRCASVAALVEERGVPTQEALAWMEASDYTITPLEEESGLYGQNEGSGAEGSTLIAFPFLPQHPETAQGVRSWDLSSYYTIELPNNGQPYAITVDLSGIARTVYWAGLVLLVCQVLSLLTGLLRNKRSIRKVLRQMCIRDRNNDIMKPHGPTESMEWVCG